MPITSIEISHNPVTAWENYHRTLYPAGIGRSADFSGLDREKLADGGFGRLRFTMPGNRAELEEFFEYALGRDVKVYNDQGRIDYEGFIFALDLNTGVHQLRKSLQHIFNRAWARYDATGGVASTQRSTTLNVEESQNRFGIIERVVGGGQQSGLIAINQAVQNKINWYAWPMVDPDLWAGRGDPDIQIVAVGYGHTLKWQVYNQVDVAGDTDLSTVAIDVIDKRGQFIASRKITVNQIQVPREYDTDRNALDVLENLAAMGDTAGNRWLSRVEVGRIYTMGPIARTV